MIGNKASYMSLINGDRLQRKLASLKRVDRRKAVRDASRETARPLWESIRNVAPKQTGLLRRTIKIRAAKKSRVRVGVNVILRGLDMQKSRDRAVISKRAKRKYRNDAQLFYGAFVEYGTKHFTARKFMKDTAERMGPTIKKAFLRRVAEIIETLAKNTK